MELRFIKEIPIDKGLKFRRMFASDFYSEIFCIVIVIMIIHV